MREPTLSAFLVSEILSPSPVVVELDPPRAPVTFVQVFRKIWVFAVMLLLIYEVSPPRTQAGSQRRPSPYLFCSASTLESLKKRRFLMEARDLQLFSICSSLFRKRRAPRRCATSGPIEIRLPWFIRRRSSLMSGPCSLSHVDADPPLC